VGVAVGGGAGGWWTDACVQNLKSNEQYVGTRKRKQKEKEKAARAAARRGRGYGVGRMGVHGGHLESLDREPCLARAGEGRAQARRRTEQRCRAQS
jgi:hypothetical protein